MSADIGFFDKLKGLLTRRTHERTTTFKDLVVQVTDRKIKVQDTAEILDTLATPEKTAEQLSSDLEVEVQRLKERRAARALFDRRGSTAAEQADLQEKLATTERIFQAAIATYEEATAALADRLRDLERQEQSFTAAGTALQRGYAGPALAELQQLGRRRQALVQDRGRLINLPGSARYQAADQIRSANDSRWGPLNQQDFRAKADKLEQVAVQAEADGAPRIQAIDAELRQLSAEEVRLQAAMLEP